MIELIQFKFLSITLIDVFDILVVSLVFYQLQIFFKNTRASRMFAGLILILIVSIFAEMLGMGGMIWLLDNLKTVWVVAFVILFQPELRRLLVRVGQAPIFHRFSHPKEMDSATNIVEAVEELRKRKWGGLIVVLKSMQLRSIQEKSMPVNAKITTPMIISVFNPGSPLHDGAILVEKDQIVAAKCILPLAETEIEGFGTRHLAALGVSEDTDVLAIVVSEETGKFSFAHKGHLTRNISKDELSAVLEKFYKDME